MAASVAATYFDHANRRSSLQQFSVNLQDKGWQSFALVPEENQDMVYHIWNDSVLLMSGCITNPSCMKIQAGWPAKVGEIDLVHAPPAEVSFLAPSTMARYEGINRRGTSSILDKEGKLKIWFTKTTNPMVLHYAGFCTYIGKGEPDYVLNCSDDGAKGKTALTIHEDNDLCLYVCEDTVFLKGELNDSQYGPASRVIGELPEAYRPRRNLQFLAPLVKYEEEHRFRVYDQSVAVTIRENGSIEVQGGKEQRVDKKGHMKILQANKKGNLCLEGLKYCLVPGEPIELAAYLRPEATKKNKKAVDLADLCQDEESSAVAIRQGHGRIIILEGTLKWAERGGRRLLGSKQAIARLPKGCWPLKREVFFTRGGSDLEERRRVDIDRWGRIFCPEGTPHDKLTLTGIIFVTDPHKQPPPEPSAAEVDYDELKLSFVAAADIISSGSSTFQGHELLEQFVRRCNYNEWEHVCFDLDRHGGRKMTMPLADVPLRGNHNIDKQNMQLSESKDLWRDYSGRLKDKFSITSFHTLLHISDSFLGKIHEEIRFDDSAMKHLRDLRLKARRRWATEREPGLTYSRLRDLAEEIGNEIWEQWDFRAQVLGALNNDFRPPKSVEKLLPVRLGRHEREVSRKIRQEERSKFDEVLQFFHLYETTGSNMTHCSLMGSADLFSSTGKWYFPDTKQVQKALFENIAWLFERELYHYISERQTMRFPFIEDFDVQAPAPAGFETLPKSQLNPPDHLIIDKPSRDAAGNVQGDPGELMAWRAKAVHMVFPQFDHLDAHIYSASGLNKGKGMLKSSFHLVWPQLIVDSQSAPIIRDVTLAIFQQETKKQGSFLNKRRSELVKLHESNEWELVFDKTTINARNGLRLPYSDKASMVIATKEDKERVDKQLMSKSKAPKKRVIEGRPSKAIGTIRFTFKKDEAGEIVAEGKWITDAKSHTIAEWIGFGTCRRDASSEEIFLTKPELGPEVLKLLPEGQREGIDGVLATHKPFPNIRIYKHSVEDFQRDFLEQLEGEQEASIDDDGLYKQLQGTFIMTNEKQAIWRSVGTSQFAERPGDMAWTPGNPRRPAEVMYIASKGKVIVDGPPDVANALLRCLESFTIVDNHAVVPIIDTSTMV